MEKPKRHGQDISYLDTREIFPRDDMTVEDVKFIENCLEKLHVDLESEDPEEYILSTNQLIFLLKGIMREYKIFMGNGKKFE